MEPDSPETHLPVTTGKKRWLYPCLLSAILLLCGMVLGGVITFTCLSSRFQDDGRPPERSPERIVERLRRELKLDDKQAAAVKEVFSRHQDQFEAIRRKVDPEVEKEMEAVRVEVEQYLHPDQREKWNKRVQEMRERHRPKLGHQNHGGPGEHHGHGEGQ